MYQALSHQAEAVWADFSPDPQPFPFLHDLPDTTFLWGRETLTEASELAGGTHCVPGRMGQAALPQLLLGNLCLSPLGL